MRKLAILVVLVSLLPSCRSRSRSTKVGSEGLKVIITMKNLQDVHKGKNSGLSYGINCSGEWNPGTLLDEKTNDAEFFVKGVKQGDFCQVRVVKPNPPADMKFLKDKGTIYATEKVIEISSRAGGQLWAEAFLAVTYEIDRGSSSIVVPVRFKGTFPSQASLPQLIAQLKCKAPGVEKLASGLLEPNGPKSTGKFRFSPVDVAEYECWEIQIRTKAKADFYYLGDMNEKFSLQAGMTHTTGEVELSAVSITTVSGITVITKPGEQCKADEVFDLDPNVRKCVKKR